MRPPQPPALSTGNPPVSQTASLTRRRHPFRAQHENPELVTPGIFRLLIVASVPFAPEKACHTFSGQHESRAVLPVGVALGQRPPAGSAKPSAQALRHATEIPCLFEGSRNREKTPGDRPAKGLVAERTAGALDGDTGGAYGDRTSRIAGIPDRAGQGRCIGRLTLQNRAARDPRQRQKEEQDRLDNHAACAVLPHPPRRRAGADTCVMDRTSHPCTLSCKPGLVPIFP